MSIFEPADPRPTPPGTSAAGGGFGLRASLTFGSSKSGPGAGEAPDAGPAVPGPVAALVESVRHGAERASREVEHREVGGVRSQVATVVGGPCCGRDGVLRLRGVVLDSAGGSGSFHATIDAISRSAGCVVELAPRRLRIESSAFPSGLRGGRADVAVTATVQAFWSDRGGRLRYRPVAHGIFVWRGVSAGTTLGPRSDWQAGVGLGSSSLALPAELRSEGHRESGVTLVIARLDVVDDILERCASFGDAFGASGPLARSLAAATRN